MLATIITLIVGHLIGKSLDWVWGDLKKAWEDMRAARA